MDQKLNLTNAEKQKIYKICKHNKFENAGVRLLYPQSSIESLDNFNKCCRFFFNLSNSDLSESESQEVEDNNLNKIKEKVNEFCKILKPVYEKTKYLIEEYYLTEMELKKRSIIQQARVVLSENLELINYTIDKTYELGKQVKQYDPDLVQGY